MLVQNGHARSRLDEGAALALGVHELAGEDALRRHVLVIVNSLLQIDRLAGRPLLKNFLALLHERVHFPLFILNLHLSDLPFHDLKCRLGVVRGQQSHRG